MWPVLLAQVSPADQPTTLTVTFIPSQVITSILIGLVAGFLANVIVRGRRAGLIGSLVIGLIGATVGGLLFSALQISLPSVLLDGIMIRYIDIIIAFIGAVIVLVAYHVLFGR